MRNTPMVWLAGVFLVSGCFNPTPCTRDADCGGPGGACDLVNSFCVTTVEGDDAGAGGGADAGLSDAGVFDAGVFDAGVFDAGVTDAGVPDAGVPDAGVPDAGAMDAGVDSGTAIDAGIPPTVSNSSPLDLATNVATEAWPTATFSEAMDFTTLTGTTFTLSQGAVRVDGGVSLDGVHTTATFTPSAPLGSHRVYTATITTGARSLAGLPLGANYSWSFTTAFLELRTAQSCSVLGASVTNTGTTLLGGDLQVSSGTITGGATITVGGTTHVGDATASLARADLQRAYTAAVNMTPTGSVSTLDAQILTPGIYTSNAVALPLNAVLTLDGQNDPNAVFLFQVDAALNTGASTARVELIRGAQASNVYWQVSGAVTLGANSFFKGTVLALEAITVGAGTVVEGRMLSLNGVVTLATNTIQ